MSEEPFDRWRRRLPFFGLPFPRLLRDMEEWSREIDRMFEDLLVDLQREAPRELIREKRLKDGSISREVGPLVYGYSITIGPDGRPQIREFGNVKPSLRGRRRLEIQDRREPIVDVIDEAETVKVIAEVPGVEKDDVKLHATEKTLSISVNAARKYYKTIDLPSPVKPETAKASYKNGILEVVLSKTEPEKPKGTSIKVE